MVAAWHSGARDDRHTGSPIGALPGRVSLAAISP